MTRSKTSTIHPRGASVLMSRHPDGKGSSFELSTDNATCPRSSPIERVQYRSTGIQTSSSDHSFVRFSAGKELVSDAGLLGNSQKNWKSAVYQRSARYYGPSSFSAVFSENQAILNEESLCLGEDGRKHPGTWFFGEPLLGRQRPHTPAIRRNHIVKALSSLPSKATCHQLFNSFKSMHDSTLDATMISHCISTMWSAFGPKLENLRSEENLVAISDILFNNEEAPLPQSPDDGIEVCHHPPGRGGEGSGHLTLALNFDLIRTELVAFDLLQKPAADCCGSGLIPSPVQNLGLKCSAFCSRFSGWPSCFSKIGIQSSICQRIKGGTE